MIKIVQGDLLSANADVICQQVNCQGVMGAGLAKEIYTKWPCVKRMYQSFCKAVGDPYMLLGMVYVIQIPDVPFIIANVFGQLNYGRQRVCYTSYDALRTAFTKIHNTYPTDKIVAFPYGFGCGLAGGDWKTVLNIIDECFVGRMVLVYKKE